MSPKEKAQQLFDLMFEEIDNRGMYDDLYRAKQCALIAVDEIIPIVNSYENALSASQQSDYLVYWYEVKQEIEKL
jgi:hypothetical protein